MTAINNDFRIDFIGIGASKSGTTWVADVLKRHPNIYYPEARKELWYFNAVLPYDFKTPNPSYDKPYSWYHEFFKNSKAENVCGEITPSYLSMANVAKDIYEYNPNIKLFAILRNPIDRAFSQYLFSQQNGMGTYDTFELAIEENPRKFIETSLYAQSLQRFYDVFPANQIKVLFFEDLKNDKEAFLKELFDFLEVPHFFEEEMNKKVNVGQQVKNKKLGSIIGKAQQLAYSKNLSFLIPLIKKSGIPSLVKRIKSKNMETRTEKPVIQQKTKDKLQTIFLKDIEQLEKMTNRDLSHWK